MPTQPKDPRATPKPFKHSHLISKPYEAEKTKKSGGFESLLNKKPTNKTLNPTPTSFSFSFMKQTLGELGPKTTNQSPNRSLCSINQQLPGQIWPHLNQSLSLPKPHLPNPAFLFFSAAIQFSSRTLSVSFFLLSLSLSSRSPFFLSILRIIIYALFTYYLFIYFYKQ